MKDLTLSRLIGTLRNSFRINRLTIDASALTAARVIHVPNRDIYLGLGEAVGMIYLWPSSTAPNGFAVCRGQLLSVSAYPDLFAVLGDTYGGDGVTTFALPKMYSTGRQQHIMRITYNDIVVVPAVVNVPAAIVGPVNDIYWAGDVLVFSVQLLEPVTVTGGPPKLSITIGAAAYLLTQSTATATMWTYEHVVQAADFGEITAAIDLNGATLTVATVPATLDSYYLPGSVLGMQLVAASASMTPTSAAAAITQTQLLSAAVSTMTPALAAVAITQTQQLSAAVSTMTPTADANAITLS
jgi:hypothetical protein